MAFLVEWIMDPPEHEWYDNVAIQDLEARSARIVIVDVGSYGHDLRWASCLFPFSTASCILCYVLPLLVRQWFYFVALYDLGHGIAMSP